MKQNQPTDRSDGRRGLLPVGLTVLATLALGAGLLLGAAPPTPPATPDGLAAPTEPPATERATPTPGGVPSPTPPTRNPSNVGASPSPDPSPTTSPRPDRSGHAPLDGVEADPSRAHRLPIAVMVDSNRRAEPQAGFNRAAIVYQAPNDGGTDRYMLVFQEQDAELVGPVRSTRLFFIGWAGEYRPALAHFGGDWRSIKRLGEIDGELIHDIDALAGSSGAFWRDKRERAPYNAYTSTEQLRRESARQGHPGQVFADLAERRFADDLPADARPASASITLPYRSGTVSYAYDHSSNSYRRSLRGTPQRDALDNSRVTARNVIVQFVPVIYDPNERYNRAFMEYVGKGRAVVFRDGRAIEGTWHKKSEGSLTRFLDEKGREISLVRGRIFIQVVPSRTNISYEVGKLP